jgi:DNA-binding SARP family transcriptional activator
MDFRLLGSLEVWDGSHRIALTRRCERLLAAVLLSPNTAVSTGRLVAAIWDCEPPETAVKQVQNCVSALRGSLGGGHLITRDGRGYRLAVSPEQVDAGRFEQHLGRARRLAASGDLAGAVECARLALAEWRGPALEGLDAPVLSAAAARLDDQRVAAVQLCAAWQLELGDHPAAIEQLSDLVARHPLREEPHAQLMAALDRGGRQADALAVFHRLRARLVDELGIDPGTELQELHAEVLARIPSPSPPRSTGGTPAAQAQTGSGRLDRAMEHLAAAVTRQWTAEAELRSLNRPRPIALTFSSACRPVTAAAVTSRIAGDLDNVVAAYRQAPSRQLVILGEPGAGKSVLAMMLTLGLLADRRPGEPVPVLLSLSSWNPHEQHLLQWLATRLREDHPALGDTERYGRDATVRLVLDGRILPVLDGLDETSPALHAAAIDALDHAIGRGRPLVVTCRAGEYEDAVTRAGALLTRASVVEIDPVRPDAAATFLTAHTTAADTRWGSVVERLRDRPGGSLARALRTPLMIDLARAGYTDRRTNPTELCDSGRFPDPETIQGHLLELYLPTTYRPRPGLPARPGERAPVRPHPPGQAASWLTFLARWLHRQNTRELAWWQLDLAVPRHVTALYLGLPPAVLYAASGWLAAGPVIGLLYGLCFGAAGVVAHGAGHRPDPLRVALRFRGRTQRFARRFVVGAAAGAAFGLGWLLPPAVTVVLALTFGIALGSHVWLAAPIEVERVCGPATVLREDRTATWAFALSLALSLGMFYGVAFALTHDAGYGKALGGSFDPVPAVAAGVAAGLLGYFLNRLAGTLAYGPAGFVVGGLVFPHAASHGRAAVAGLVFGLAVGCSVCVARAWGRYTLTRLWLGARRQLPLDLMHFLDDAHRRGVLRRAGAVYQFRHALLQDRLAARVSR